MIQAKVREMRLPSYFKYFKPFHTYFQNLVYLSLALKYYFINKVFKQGLLIA